MRWIKRLFSSGTLETELDKELSDHLERRVADLIADGMDRDAAMRQARLEFGGTEQVKETCRDARGTRWIEECVYDCRYALRTMSSNKTFTLLAILSLALGIGANTAIFSFMDAILLRSLPVSDPASLVTLHWHTQRAEFHGLNHHDDDYEDPNGGHVGGIFAYPAFEIFRENTSVFSSIFGYQGAGSLNVNVKGAADTAIGEYVSGEFFRGLGVSPAAGRLIVSDDDQARAPAVAVVSFALSEKSLGGAANAPGQTILINNIPCTVIGVTPPEFFGTDPDGKPDLYLPMHTNLVPVMRNPFGNPDFEWVEIMARLQPGVTAAQAQAALAPGFSEWQRTVNTVRRRDDLPTLVVKEASGGLDVLRRRYSKPLYVLLIVVGLILTVACANIANLLLARAAFRRREIAVRLSLGAKRLRVIRQLLTESILLALLSGTLGVGFAVWGIRSLTFLLANGRESFTLRAELNWHVLGVLTLLSVCTGILFGLAPALQSTKMDLGKDLKQARIGGKPASFWPAITISRVLVVSQIVITLLIVVASGLFLRTLSNLESVQLGFNRENLLTFRMDARQAGHRDPEIVTFYDELRRKFAALPGVESATLSGMLLVGNGNAMTMVGVSGSSPKGTRVMSIGHDFFTAMQIPMLSGRGIEESDRPGSPYVAVVNEAFAKSYFGAEDPIGKSLTFSYECAKCEVQIVGVSRNTMYGSLKGRIGPVVYLPYAQAVLGPVSAIVYELRTRGNPLASANTVREIVRGADSRIPLSEVQTQTAWIDQGINPEIIFARLCTVFGILALVISSVGLYATVSYNVARRTGEIGIRIALGARASAVLWTILGEVVLLVALGLMISVPIAIALSKYLESFLFGIKPNDPVAFAVAVMTLATATVLAGYAPARKASRIDPTIALRHE
jgi:macrolide transport system ATP-binding/permease protein